MKRTLLILALAWPLLCVVSCKKVIEDKKKEYVLGIMTTGRWYLQSVTENGVDLTADFMEYEFQFYENKKIDAISVLRTTTGNWIEDISNLTMTVKFPQTMDALDRLNQAWKLLDSSPTAVLAEATTPNGKTRIIFRKKV